MWIIEHWDVILIGVTGIVTGASIIAKCTPTETDDKIIGRILQFIDRIALNNKPTEIK